MDLRSTQAEYFTDINTSGHERAICPQSEGYGNPLVDGTHYLLVSQNSVVEAFTVVVIIYHYIVF